MSLVEKICEELGVEVGNDWVGNDGNIYIISEDGNLMLDSEDSLVLEISDIRRVLTGELKPVWKPKFEERYYVPEIRYDELYDYWTWSNDDFDNRLLERGLVFKTKEEAEECSLNLIALCKEGI